MAWLHALKLAEGQKRLDEAAAGSAGGKGKPSEQSAQILALLEVDAAAVDFRDVAHDGEAEAGPGLAGRVEPRTPREQLTAPRLRDAWAIVLDQDVDLLTLGLDGHEDASATVFGGILDEIAEHFVEVLPFDAHL